MANGERSRVLDPIKARGSSHSNQVREYRITDTDTDTGIELVEPYVGPERVPTGTARATQAAREQEVARLRQQEIERRRRARAQARRASRHRRGGGSTC